MDVCVHNYFFNFDIETLQLEEVSSTANAWKNADDYIHKGIRRKCIFDYVEINFMHFLIAIILWQGYYNVQVTNILMLFLEKHQLILYIHPTSCKFGLKIKQFIY